MKIRHARRFTAALLAGGLAFGLAACDDTVEGAGDDAEQIGDNIEEETNELDDPNG